MKNVWSAELAGDRIDLTHLQSCFPEGCDPQIVEQGGTFYLISERFSSKTDPGEVQTEAKNLLQELNNIAKYSFKHYKNPVISCIRKTNGDHHYVLAGGEIILRSSVRGNATVISSDGKEQQPYLTQAEINTKIHALYLNDSNVRKALDFFNKSPTPTTLYNIYEIIRSEFGGENSEKVKENFKKLFNIDYSEIESFRSIHDPDMTDNPRHAVQKKTRPQNPFTFAESLNFVDRLLHKWIDYKINERSSP